MNTGVRKRLAQFPEALEPVYTTQSPNASILLFKGNLKLTLASGQTIPGSGRIELRWIPFPAIRYSLSTSESLLGTMDFSAEVKVSISDLKLSCDAFLLGMYGMYTSNEGVYEGLLKPPVPVIGHEGKCKRVVFHLPNFFAVMGRSIRNRDHKAWLGRLCLESDTVRVILDEMSTAKDLIKELNNQGGFGLTHTGALERIDGGLLSYDDAGDALSALHYYLSFTRGFWCGPMLAIGQVDDTDAWQFWRLPNLTSWKYVETWFPKFDRFNKAETNKAFCGFMTKWNDQLWKSPIKNTIHWYIESNVVSGGIEGSIILTQTALELLGWLYLVEDTTTRQFSVTCFNGMRATERIRELLSSLDIPICIPSRLTKLRSEAPSLGASDGPQVIAKLRNAIVHPRKTKRSAVQSISVLARKEARELGLWYVEMALLRIFGYEGEYYQRFESRRPEYRAKVPWA